MRLITIILFTSLVMSSTYAAKSESEFIFFGYLGIVDSDNSDIDFTEFNISCVTLSGSPNKCNTSADEQGFFILNCPNFLNHNISCNLFNSVTQSNFPIYFDISDFGRSQILKPTGKLFTPIGVDYEEGSAYAGEIPADNKPE